MSKTCTCPSGDGSLRHPCPSHPPVCAEIKPDTSLYTDMPSRLRATALVAEHSVGKIVQMKSITCGHEHWIDISFPSFAAADAIDYRIKPEPDEWWVNVYPGGYYSSMFVKKETADRDARRDRIRCIKVREVLD